MTEDMLDLARRAVACPKWRWMPGMATAEGRRIAFASNYNDDFLPNLTDPATLGCLLALVREAHNRPEAHTHYANVSSLWVVRWGEACVGEWFGGYGATEAHALVAALEAAP